jgi:hypothetical protein
MMVWLWLAVWAAKAIEPNRRANETAAARFMMNLLSRASGEFMAF